MSEHSRSFRGAPCRVESGQRQKRRCRRARGQVGVKTLVKTGPEPARRGCSMPFTRAHLTQGVSTRSAGCQPSGGGRDALEVDLRRIYFKKIPDDSKTLCSCHHIDTKHPPFVAKRNRPRTVQRQPGNDTSLQTQLYRCLQKVVSRKERKSRDWKLTVIVTQTQRRLTLVKMR